jgi:hypothetical protein
MTALGHHQSLSVSNDQGLLSANSGLWVSSPQTATTGEHWPDIVTSTSARLEGLEYDMKRSYRCATQRISLFFAIHFAVRPTRVGTAMILIQFMHRS